MEAGITTGADKAGNDTSDANPDEGVEKINGKRLVVLGTWIAERHDQSKKLMIRFHEMIAIISLLGKMERGKDESIQMYL